MKQPLLLILGVAAILCGCSLALLLLPLAGVRQPRLEGMEYVCSVLDGLRSLELRRGTLVSFGLLSTGLLYCVSVSAPRRIDTDLRLRDYRVRCGSVVVSATLALCGLLVAVAFHYL